MPWAAETPDSFQGSFKRSIKAKWVYSFPPAEVDMANAVKWAIESATGIYCLYRDCDLLAEAAPSTANRLARIAELVRGEVEELRSEGKPPPEPATRPMREAVTA